MSNVQLWLRKVSNRFVSFFPTEIISTLLFTHRSSTMLFVVFYRRKRRKHRNQPAFSSETSTNNDRQRECVFCSSSQTISSCFLSFLHESMNVCIGQSTKHGDSLAHACSHDNQKTLQLFDTLEDKSSLFSASISLCYSYVKRICLSRVLEFHSALFLLCLLNTFGLFVYLSSSHNWSSISDRSKQLVSLRSRLRHRLRWSSDGRIRIE